MTVHKEEKMYAPFATFVLRPSLALTWMEEDYPTADLTVDISSD
jgi:hypothetical protein